MKEHILQIKWDPDAENVETFLDRALTEVTKFAARNAKPKPRRIRWQKDD